MGTDLRFYKMRALIGMAAGANHGVVVPGCSISLGAVRMQGVGIRLVVFCTSLEIMAQTPLGKRRREGGLVCQTITQGHLVCGGKHIILLQPRARKKDLAVQSPIIVGFSVISKESAIVRKDPMPVPGPDGSSQNRGSHCQNTDPKNVPIKRPTSFRVSSPDQGKKQAAG